ncbi:hypothetical protein MC885_006086 [Smutsia gigantea]|nr:hypothetical protein MC885_006086 [Smutsia gigantea]
MNHKKLAGTMGQAGATEEAVLGQLSDWILPWRSLQVEVETRTTFSVFSATPDGGDEELPVLALCSWSNLQGGTFHEPVRGLLKQTECMTGSVMTKHILATTNINNAVMFVEINTQVEAVRSAADEVPHALVCPGSSLRAEWGCGSGFQVLYFRKGNQVMPSALCVHLCTSDGRARMLRSFKGSRHPPYTFMAPSLGHKVMVKTNGGYEMEMIFDLPLAFGEACLVPEQSRVGGACSSDICGRRERGWEVLIWESSLGHKSGHDKYAIEKPGAYLGRRLPKLNLGIKPPRLVSEVKGMENDSGKLVCCDALPDREESPPDRRAKEGAVQARLRNKSPHILLLQPSQDRSGPQPTHVCPITAVSRGLHDKATSLLEHSELEQTDDARARLRMCAQLQASAPQAGLGRAQLGPATTASRPPRRVCAANGLIPCEAEARGWHQGHSPLSASRSFAQPTFRERREPHKEEKVPVWGKIGEGCGEGRRAGRGAAGGNQIKKISAMKTLSRISFVSSLGKSFKFPVGCKTTYAVVSHIVATTKNTYYSELNGGYALVIPIGWDQPSYFTENEYVVALR